MVAPGCSSPSFHQILPLCSIRLSTSVFDTISVRRACRWLGLSMCGMEDTISVFLSGRIATGTKPA